TGADHRGVRAAATATTSSLPFPRSPHPARLARAAPATTRPTKPSVMRIGREENPVVNRHARIVDAVIRSVRRPLRDGENEIQIEGVKEIAAGGMALAATNTTLEGRGTIGLWLATRSRWC